MLINCIHVVIYSLLISCQTHSGSSMLCCYSEWPHNVNVNVRTTKNKIHNFFDTMWAQCHVCYRVVDAQTLSACCVCKSVDQFEGCPFSQFTYTLIRFRWYDVTNINKWKYTFFGWAQWPNYQSPEGLCHWRSKCKRPKKSFLFWASNWEIALFFISIRGMALIALVK